MLMGKSELSMWKKNYEKWFLEAFKNENKRKTNGFLFMEANKLYRISHFAPTSFPEKKNAKTFYSSVIKYSLRFYLHSVLFGKSFVLAFCVMRKRKKNCKQNRANENETFQTRNLIEKLIKVARFIWFMHV